MATPRKLEGEALAKRQLVNQLMNELAGAELIAALNDVGVTVTVNDTPKPEGPPPKGCIRGEDGIIRSLPGVFEQGYKLKVQRLAQSDRRYRREAHALDRLERQRRGPANKRPRAATRRPAEGRPRSHKPRSRTRARAPDRESGDDADAGEADPLAPRPCVNCGHNFAPKRRRQEYCEKQECRRARDAAKAAAYRLRGREAVVAAWERDEIEAQVVQEVGSGRLSPEDAVLWLVVPDRMRATVPVRAAA